MDEPVRRVASFVEKPDAVTARRYCEAGYRWNAGIFAWTPSALLRAAAESPLAAFCSTLTEAGPEAGFARVDEVSIDRAVIERADECYVVPAGFEWADLGTWEGVWRARAGEQADGTVRIGAVEARETRNCLVATDGRVATLGIEDLVVASFDGRTVVFPRERAEEAGELASALEGNISTGDREES